jgi:LAO/AO transport system kinase
MVHERLQERLAHDPALRRRMPEVEDDIGRGALSPEAGAGEILRLLGL